MSKKYSEEFIGTELMVVQARNKDLEGIKGRVIDETKHTFRILTNKKQEKTLLKQGAVFMINKHRIMGKDLLRRPEERIKAK